MRRACAGGGPFMCEGFWCPVFLMPWDIWLPVSALPGYAWKFAFGGGERGQA